MIKNALTQTKHTTYAWCVSSINNAGAAQLALTLGGHFGEDVALVRVFELETSTGFFKALGGATVYFSFGCHVMKLHTFK
jgi:hypothetical protein